MSKLGTILIFVLGGLLMCAVGLIVSIPRIIKIVKCKESTKGVITKAEDNIDVIKAHYEYFVDGKKYMSKTGWTQTGIFTKEIEVMYNKDKPELSYMKNSGQFYNAAVGIVVALGGFAATVLIIVLALMGAF